MLPKAEMTLAGRVIPYTLRHSARARWPSGFASPETGLVVTLPVRAPLQAAESFLLKHQRWVLRELDRLATRTATFPKPWPYGTSLSYRGEPHEVVIRQARRGGVERGGSQLIVSTPSAGVDGARRVLQRWLKAEAALVLNDRVRVLGAQMGLKAKRVYVRNLRSRWGCCWPGGSLSFNYRLIMAPPRILDYVVIHELAHLKEANHSKRFWAMVEGHYPEQREARTWLRTFGPRLSV